MNPPINGNLGFFTNLISCNQNLYYWSYDTNLNPIYNNCPNASAYETIFELNGCKAYLASYLLNNQMPLILNDSMGLVWIAAFETKDNTVIRVHIIGPAFISDISDKTLERELEHLKYSIKQKNKLIIQLRELPVISMLTYNQYGIMLHYSITGKKISVSDFNYQLYPMPDIKYSSPELYSTSYHGTWFAEQTLIKMLKNGNLNYHNAFNKLSTTGAYGQFCIGDPMRQAKDYVLIFITICSRAAIKGGLYPETSYAIADFYYQSIENATTISETREISHTMFNDYVTRVHKNKTTDGVTRQIKECCDYILLHVNEKLNIADIASLVGYTKYYLTKKFKKEMGCSINNYIKNAKIEHAKLLLRSTQMNIQDISETLNFCSQSYFAEAFRKITGYTPGDYRTKNTTH